MITDMEKEMFSDNSFSQWVLVESCTKADELNGFNNSETVIKICDNNPNSKTMKYDIQFIVNGVELPFIETMTDLWKQFEYQVNKRAEEIINEKSRERLEQMEKLLKDFDNTVRNDLVIPEKNSWEY